MKLIKRVLQLTLVAEIIAIIYLNAKDSISCHGDCFGGFNNSLIVVLPLMGATLIGLIVLKLISWSKH